MMWALTVTWVAALISTGIAMGLMLRFYLGQPKMPWGGFLGFFGYAVAATGAIVINITHGSDFEWQTTPFVLMGSIAVICGVVPRLRWRKGQVVGDKSDYVRDARLWRARNQRRRRGD